MSDVRIAQTTIDSKQSQIESDDMLIVNSLNVRSQNKTILEDVSFRVKKGTSLAIVGPNGGGKTTVFRTLLNTIRYTGMIKWNGEVRMGYVPQSLVSTDLPILVEDIGAEEPIYEKVNDLKKELGITVLLISHNMHVVMHYSDYVLALDKRVLFFGETKSLTHSQLLSTIYGNEFALSEEEHYKE